MSDKNILYYGDNLEVLRLHIKDESVDLIYLDPPFKSNQDYNVLFAERNGARSRAQIKAFDDTWFWGEEAAESYQDIVEAGGKVSEAMQAFRKLLGHNDMMAYLAIMAPRLVELNRVLKPTGSIYLHCDPTASHYLKLLMDAVFTRNFRNEIVWHYRRWTAASKTFQKMHDVLLWYSKTRTWVYNKLMQPFSEKTAIATFKRKVEGGRAIQDKTRLMDRDPSKGVAMHDVWDIPYVHPVAKERLGYPTQKPEALLERIIRASSNECNVVLDPFCGCGTTITVAQKLNRRWIGIDVTHLAVTLIKHRLQDTFGEKIKDTYDIVGEPVSISGAMELAKQDPYQFQWWALGLVGARPAEQKKGADEGIDGRLYFHDEGKGRETKQIIFSVKAGHVGVSHIRDLRGVMERENAEMGVLITMQPPTKPMQREAARAEFYHSPGWNKRYPRIQVLSVEELIGGKGVNYPPSKHVNVTFKKAPKAKPNSDCNSSDLFN
ncbi:MAG TPA: DNA methyltransferase [bacterium]|nr:DNA methyltransferase [bacterium]